MLMELAGCLEPFGWHCDLKGASDFSDDKPEAAPRFRAFLEEHAGDYDVIDYDYKYADFRRSTLSRNTLFVARAQLLLHHHALSPLPPLRMGRPLVHLLKCQADKLRKARRLPGLDRSLRDADLVTVLNEHARWDLINRKILPEKIFVFPNGMDQARRLAFDGISEEAPPDPVVAFIGMFGPRKGSIEFPALVRKVLAKIPHARFRLFGTRGMYRTADAVLRLFDHASRSRIDVVPVYDPAELPQLLGACSVGVFPSYAEGFPLGVMEMLAAALPVVAYDAPGAPEMLPTEWLVPVRHINSMANMVVHWLEDDKALERDRHRAKRRSRDFVWEDIAARTDAIYSDALFKLRKRVTNNVY